MEKTFFMIYTKSKTKHNFNIYMNNQLIRQTTSIKYLGVNFDDKLNWSTHLTALKNKISKGAWALAKLRKFVKLDTLIMIYYSLIYSHLNYCIIPWGFASEKYLKPVFTLQKKVMRIMTHSFYLEHTNPIFHRLSILKLNDITKLKVGITAFKLINKKNPLNYQNNYLSNLVKLTATNEVHTYRTRSQSNNNFYIPFARTNLGKSALQHQIPLIWNLIPSDIRNSPNISIFKSKYKHYLINQYIEE